MLLVQAVPRQREVQNSILWMLLLEHHPKKLESVELVDILEGHVNEEQSSGQTKAIQ